jgi:RNA polymerase sigma-70 factor (TIGR02960 family)
MTSTTNEDFEKLTDPFRRELLAHCYRMLGSIQDAEDLVQETYVRAWRSFDRFEGRSSLRVWLYKIATNACLSALETRRRRPLPSDLGPASHDPRQALASSEPGMAWLQPIPDALIAAPSSDPGALLDSHAGVRLAFIAALQTLSARQRAVLILRDVLAWRAAEVAELLDTTTHAVNSALRRARTQLERSNLAEDELVDPIEAELREILDRYVDAFERADVTALVDLLRADVELEMPPTPTWFTGRDAVAGFLGAEILVTPGRWRMTPTRANGQLAVVIYERGLDGYVPHGVNVLTFIGERIARVTVFNDADLVPYFERRPQQPSRDAHAVPARRSFMG